MSERAEHPAKLATDNEKTDNRKKLQSYEGHRHGADRHVHPHLPDNVPVIDTNTVSFRGFRFIVSKVAVCPVVGIGIASYDALGHVPARFSTIIFFQLTLELHKV